MPLGVVVPLWANTVPSRIRRCPGSGASHRMFPFWPIAPTLPGLTASEFCDGLWITGIEEMRNEDESQSREYRGVAFAHAGSSGCAAARAAGSVDASQRR